MSYARAQPALDLTIPDNKPTQSSRNAEAKFLFRMPIWLRDLVREAADTEGLSMNAWLQRTVAEASKMSNDGWRTIPVDDPSRKQELHIQAQGIKINEKVKKAQIVSPLPSTLNPPYTIQSNPYTTHISGNSDLGSITYNYTTTDADGNVVGTTGYSYVMDADGNLVEHSTSDGTMAPHYDKDDNVSTNWTPPDDDIPEPL